MPLDETRLTGLLAQARHRLLDTSACPACGSDLQGQRCAACGLDASGAAGESVWRASLAAVTALEDRAALITTIRSAQRAAPAAASRAPRSPAAHPVGAAAAYLPPSAPPVYSNPAFLPPRAPTAVPNPVYVPIATVRAPWRVQTVLQVLGVALLATASIVFLIFSWNVLSVAARGAVVGLVTVVVLVLAAWLLRRGLGQSAQAVGVLGAVLTVLDAWAVHAAGLVGPVDPAAYAAAACVVCAGLLGAYGVATGVRAGTVSAAVLLPVAPLMLLGHASSPAAAAGLLLVSLGLATLRFVPGPRLAAERATLAAAAVASAVAAGLTASIGVLAAADEAQRWASIGVLLGTAVLCASQAALSASAARAAERRTTIGRAWCFAAGILTATAATATATVVTVGAPAPVGPAAVAALLGLVLAAWPVTRPGHGLARAGTDGVTLGALVAGVPTVLVVLAAGVGVAIDPWAGAWSQVAEPLLGTAALILLLLVVGRRRGSAVAAPARHGAAVLTVVVVLVGAGSLGATAASSARLGATAALLAVAIVAAAVEPGRNGALRWYLRGCAVLALVGALMASLGLPWWTGGVLAASTVVAFSARRWGGGVVGAALSSTTAALLGFLALTQLAVAAGRPADLAAAGAAALSVAVLSAVALGRRPSSTERHALLVLAGALGTAGWATGWSGAAGDSVTAADGVALLVAVVVWAAALAVAVRGRHTLAPVASQLAAGLLAPLAALVVLTADELTAAPGPDALPLVVVVLGGIAVVAAGLVPGRPVDLRPALEASGWAVVLVGPVLASARGADLTAVALVLAALVAGASALRPDRRGERWLALGLVVLASWCSLGARDVGTPEAYLAPLGIVLAVVGVRRWRHGRPAAELVGGGLALVTVPVAVLVDPLVLGGSALPRPVLATVLAATVVGAALVIGHVRRPHRAAAGADPLLVLAGLGALLAVVAPLRRAVVIAVTSWSTDGPDGPVLTWALAAAALLGAAAVAALRAPVAHAAEFRRAAVWAVLLVATVPAVLTHDDGPVGLALLLAVAALGTALAVRGASAPRAGTPDLLAQGVVLLGAATLAALLRTWPIPDDATLAVVGGLLLVIGVVHLIHVPGTGSWIALGPGLVLALLIPTVTALATGTGWRVGLVVVGGLVAVGAGARLRWQAPFLVGAAALVGELLVQLAPVTRAAVGGLGWWPVLAIGGAALLGLGLTYERRLRDAREAVRYVSVMR